jgi:hypothetical protein
VGYCCVPKAMEAEFPKIHISLSRIKYLLKKFYRFTLGIKNYITVMAVPLKKFRDFSKKYAL